jgi:hypothetical protein
MKPAVAAAVVATKSRLDTRASPVGTEEGEVVGPSGPIVSLMCASSLNRLFAGS